MSKAPAVQWYWSDFLIDTMGWSCMEIGAYMRLLGFEWVNGCIPEETKRQAMICRIDHGNYLKSIYPNVIGKFVFSDGGGHNPRLEIERSKQHAYSENQREKGKIRASKMWEGHIATATLRLQPEGQPKDSSSSSSSSSLYSSKKQKNIYMPFFESFWTKYPKRNGKIVGRKECLDYVRTIKPEHYQDILRAVENYAGSEIAHNGYCKDPIRFLKKDFWADWLEPEELKKESIF